ncbi:MAG: cellulose synthase (UDP-forming), cellulose synthase (UDP-forming) [candidate division WWE3 bacterium GW2011_GWC1_41_7]|uniref:Cellulose synthase (UDP-forming) n=3 Tax=Katanobacteria TaxID=422282 RepID=A0A0G1ABZ7_UNCKA|nr:MAG: Cellulose synthase (UDP-forming) [candidate division WWE3 bacterium GW2011_GWB1_41_6]KKS20490.1 MAG: cellulose synthase (UDP-forming), cellulose synthase (UDP-forming) [candidate division WWE3 bacterium GW2011_GWC1_41_7]KKS22803.1 MAG: Cellulose synthase (UDP-forming) [candidate division WWE3 bacterium GW2011_GWA1_41_8]
MSNEKDPIILTNYAKVSKLLISTAVLLTLIYFTWWLNINNAGHPVLYTFLVVGEIFHVWQALGYAYTIYNQKRIPFKMAKYYHPVDIYITVCGEPVEVVEKTVRAVMDISYPYFNAYVLNDSKGAGKDNWEDIDIMAERYGAVPISRPTNKGFKAGNVNNAMRLTKAPYIAIFDADQIPEKNFLIRTMGYFNDEKMALVQTPQYYVNKGDNFLTRAAWEQQELFFGPICNGKNKSNATFWCGTNAIIKRKAIESIGGVPEDNIAEDFLASLFLHEQGWSTIYIPEILAKGLAPHNLEDYVNQQFRWARGSLEVIFKYNPLFRRGLSWAQKMQYLYSSGYYLNGIIVLIDAAIPLLALGFDALPVSAETSDFMVYFFPFIFSTIFLLMMSTRNQITFNAIQMSMSSFFVFFTATISAALNIKVKFKVTSKSKESGNYLKLVIPHMIYIVLTIIAIVVAVIRDGIVPSVVTNASWAIFNIIFFSGFLRVAYPWETVFEKLTKPVTLGLEQEVAEEFAFPFVEIDTSLHTDHED